LVIRRGGSDKRQDSKTKAIENTRGKPAKPSGEKSTTPVPPQGADSHHEATKAVGRTSSSKKNPLPLARSGRTYWHIGISYY